LLAPGPQRDVPRQLLERESLGELGSGKKKRAEKPRGSAHQCGLKEHSPQDLKLDGPAGGDE
jgi:hypothetical protein